MQTRLSKIGTANNMQFPLVPPAALCAANGDKRDSLFEYFNSQEIGGNPFLYECLQC